MTQPRAQERLGDLLVERGLITREQLDEALMRQQRGGARLGEILVGMGAITQEQLTWALSEALHIPFVELSEEVVDLDVARSIPEEVLRRLEAVPILRVGNEITVLLADPTDRRAAIELEALSGARVIPALTTREAVLHFLDRAFPRPGRSVIEVALEANGRGGTAEDLSGVSQAFALLLDAVREGASELYLEPRSDGVTVRTRIGDQLLDRTRLSRDLLVPLTYRLRVLAGLRSEPGPRLARVRTRLGGRDVALELLFFPTLDGEAVTVRVHQGGRAPTVDELRPTAAARAALGALVDRSGAADTAGGIVLVAGPDARARAEALYALALLGDDPKRRTLTVERSAFFVVPGFLQIELSGEFPGGAATVLGQHADVVVVEDLRPPPVAVAALAQAERGALVLGGIGFASLRSALAHLATAELRGPLLALTRGVVEARHREPGGALEALPLTPALRRELLERRDPWTSPSF
ncbi:MAG TPA: ATPase, T2SS/T4P/T4SS family [Methylomirabilota bacterium]|nr:ATPase, T2SS/T4P/T4SS family [Methylomirabilota bacterium]